MGKKCVMGRGKRQLILLAKRLLAALAVGALAAVFANSFITVEDNDGIINYFISPLAQKDEFENSQIFNDILRKDIQNTTRMAVIKSQLETNGVYDGKKIIDIAAYVNRTNMLAEEAVTAEYYLEDLIKWGNYGFSYTTVYGTEEDFNRYFVRTEENIAAEDYYMDAESAVDSAVILSREALRYSSRNTGADTLSQRIISEMPDTMEEYRERAEAEGRLPVSEETVYGVDILIPRYLSAEGGDLAEYAGNLNEYVRLRDMLTDASDQLRHNYMEYGSFKNLYGEDKTNIRYCYRTTIDGQTCYFTNLSADFSGMKDQEITDCFTRYGKYMYYDSRLVELGGNIQITTAEMQQILGNYEYAFAENAGVWIGVDTSYSVGDSLSQARNAFVRFMPYYWQTAGTGMVAGILCIWLLVLLTMYEGRVEADNEDGYRVALKKGDRFPSELVLLFLCLVISGFLMLAYAAGELAAGYNPPLGDRLDPFRLALAAAVASFLMDWLGTFLYLSLVRRLKVHMFWKNSILWRVGGFLKKTVLQLYDNSGIVIKVLLPFCLLVLFNLLMGRLGRAGILPAAALDFAAGLLIYLDRKDLKKVVEGTQTIGGGRFGTKIDASRMHGENRLLAEAVNSIGDGIQEAVATSMKDERLKTDLITNVSHDIKTPLTSIINFVKLLKRENIQDEKICGYIDVLDAKSQRLKQLTDDLVEASKISSGNISLQMERINFVELINQTMGEFSEKMDEKCLLMVSSMPEDPVYIEADSRRIWRVVENLFGNVYKYALEGTRVYLDLTVTEDETDPDRKVAVFSMKNISAQALNIRAEELTERFIRGDVSRSTEGSGLGLSIAQNLTQLQNGKFQIYLDGDLFKVILTFPCID